MEIKRDFIAAVVLSLLFTVGFLYLIPVIPLILHEILLPFMPDPYFSGWELIPIYDSSVEKLNPIGSILFLAAILLIIIGVIIKRFKLSFLGSFTLYLPIFANFCFIMFMFAGIGLSRLLWYPILQINPQILSLGDFIGSLCILLDSFLQLLNSIIRSLDILQLIFHYIVEMPFLLLFFFLLASIETIGIGIFVFSTITWFYGKFSEKQLLDFWIYKYSRHPQYLGLLVWSYGLIALASTTALSFGSSLSSGPNPTIFWLISALFIIAAAIQEENRLMIELKEEHETWRQNTPFLLPLPSRIKDGVQWVVKRLIKKDWPSDTKEILIVLAFFGILIIISSLLFLYIVLFISDLVYF